MASIRLETRYSDDTDYSCGTKAITLSELKKLGLPIPDFYSISSSFFESFCDVAKIRNLSSFYSCSTFDSEAAQKFNCTTILDMTNIARTIVDGQYMVRSSSIPTEEVDLTEFSSMISGAFESYFAHSIEEVLNDIPKVWESAYSENAYNQCRIFSHTSIVSSMGVLIQKYIEPVISGVAHTCGDEVSVNWIDGHLSEIVSGKSLGHSIGVHVTDSNEYILRGIEKDVLLIIENGYKQVFKSLWDYCNTIRRHFNSEQEVEWIYDGSKFWVVQSQPLIIEK
jgi:phosphoenolpyruvate synthase/pyruvate phosphate dikinase